MGKRRAQLSLEALVAVAVLLSCISLLAYAANHLSASFRESIGTSAAQYSLSYAALCMDTAAYSMHGAKMDFHLMANATSNGEKLFSVAYPRAQEHLLHRATADAKGEFYVESSGLQPV